MVTKSRQLFFAALAIVIAATFSWLLRPKQTTAVDPEIACQIHASRETAKDSTSPFRFGYSFKNDECRPKEAVNCGALTPGWKVPQGCQCYVYGREDMRSAEYCLSEELFACPFGSGLGCGYLGVIDDPETTCKPSHANPPTPQILACNVDLPGTLHDRCCAKNWGVSASPLPRCNGCSDPKNKAACTSNITTHQAVRFVTEIAINTDFPCAEDWMRAIDENYSFGGYNAGEIWWPANQDTERRFTASQVASNLEKFFDEFPELKADSGQVFYHLPSKSDSTPKIKDVETIMLAKFCKSDAVKLESGVLLCK